MYQHNDYFIFLYYCEIVITRVVLIFADFVVHLSHQNKNTISPLIVACNVWNQEFKNPWINTFCRNHGNWCQGL